MTLLYIAGLVSAQLPQAHLDVASVDTQGIFTPALKQFAEDVLRNWSVPGMAVGVAYANNTVEHEAFGIMTEDSARVTTNVSSSFARLRSLAFADAVRV